MSVEEILKNHGFNFSASCGGKASYTKWIKYNGKRAYITVNDANGDSFPTTLEEPVRVTVYDLKSGDELGTPQEISSLSAYLASLTE
jgi:intein/homing endonuclease